MLFLSSVSPSLLLREDAFPTFHPRPTTEVVIFKENQGKSDCSLAVHMVRTENPGLHLLQHKRLLGKWELSPGKPLLNCFSWAQHP